MNMFRNLMMILGSISVLGQGLNLEKPEAFLAFVDPIMTQGEREIYEKLAGFQEKDYFESIFWFKRNPTPYSASNPFRRTYFERRHEANIRFGEGSLKGTQTQRGRIFLLLGEPDNVIQRRLSAGDPLSGFEEIWEYFGTGTRFRFLLEQGGTRYRLDAKDGGTGQLEALKADLILDRAVSYQLKPFRISLPNVGSTKDIENLTLADRYEINFSLSYAFFKGDRSQTSVYVTITFHDASPKGLELNLNAYDPFENKVVDFKQKRTVVNGEPISFFIVLAPDQYDMVLRVRDRDGREAVDRKKLDIPQIGGPRSASSLLLSDGLRPIPIQGFDLIDQFVFGRHHFPVGNTFQRLGQRLFVMQHFYQTDDAPQSEYLIGDRKVDARPESVIRQDDGTVKAVVSLPVSGLQPGMYEIKARRKVGTSWLTSNAILRVGPFARTGFRPQLIQRARESEQLRLVQPATLSAEFLDTVAIKADEGIDVRHMYLFLNDRLIQEKEAAPWRIDLDPGVYSISGKHVLTVVCQTNRGLLKLTREIKPRRVDEQIKSRAVQIFFNAYNEDLDFVPDIDLNSIRVEVDGEAQKPMEIHRLEEPITYCFLVDTSFSMKDSFQGNIAAIKVLIEALRPEDTGYFISFNDNYHQHLEPTRGKGVLKAVADSLPLQRPNPKQSDGLYEENETYLYDAVIASIHTLLQYPGRKVVVLVSDGIGTEGIFSKNAMLSYTQENDVVIYSLWLDNNPRLSDDDSVFLRKDMGKGERFARAIGLSRFFAQKDHRKNKIGAVIRNASITEGAVKMLSEESGGFHYRIFKADRTLIQAYVKDIEAALGSQYGITLNLPVTDKTQYVDVFSEMDAVSIRAKSQIKVRKTNPLAL